MVGEAVVFSKMDFANNLQIKLKRFVDIPVQFNEFYPDSKLACVLINVL